jgi:hypothetical protein
LGHTISLDNVPNLSFHSFGSAQASLSIKSDFHSKDHVNLWNHIDGKSYLLLTGATAPTLMMQKRSGVQVGACILVTELETLKGLCCTLPVASAL